MKILQIIITLFVFSLCCNPLKAEAQVAVTPTVISESGKNRDGFDFVINVKNSGQSNLRIFPLVADIDFKEGRGSFLKESGPESHNFLSSWVDISRSRLELRAGSEEELPLTIRIDNRAEPGSYYGVVVFARGRTQDEAMRNASTFNYAQTLININVEEDIVERAQLISFNYEKESFFDTEVEFFLTVENIGNKEVVPDGSIILYKSKQGRELDSLPINEEGVFIDPGAQEAFEIKWDAKDGLGEYKATLMGEYGEETRRDIQDTVYFWIVPQYFVLAFAGGLFLLTLFLIYFLTKKEKQYVPVYRSVSTTLDLSSPK